MGCDKHDKIPNIETNYEARNGTSIKLGIKETNIKHGIEGHYECYADSDVEGVPGITATKQLYTYYTQKKKKWEKSILTDFRSANISGFQLIETYIPLSLQKCSSTKGIKDSRELKKY